MSIWQIIPSVLLLLFLAMIIGLIWFVWAIFTGRMELLGSGYEAARRETKARIKTDPHEVNDPTVWLPQFAQQTKVNAITESRGSWGPLSRAQYSHKIRVETVQKPQEQLDEEKRVYFEAKEKRS